MEQEGSSSRQEGNVCRLPERGGGFMSRSQLSLKSLPAWAVASTPSLHIVSSLTWSPAHWSRSWDPTGLAPDLFYACLPYWALAFLVLPSPQRFPGTGFHSYTLAQGTLLPSIAPRPFANHSLENSGLGSTLNIVSAKPDFSP